MSASHTIKHKPKLNFEVHQNTINIIRDRKKTILIDLTWKKMNIISLVEKNSGVEMEQWLGKNYKNQKET